MRLVGAVVTMIHTIGSGIDFSVGELTGVLFLPVAIAIFLIWCSKYTQGQGWIET